MVCSRHSLHRRRLLSDQKVTAEMRRWLESQTEENYRSFQHKLMPGVENYLGVRLPKLRRFAAQLAKGNWQAEFSQPDETFEETMLRGLTIGQLDLPKEELLDLVRQFVPCIDNWAVCDSFCASLHQTKLYKSEFFELIKQYSGSEKTFEARFAAVMLLDYYKSEADLAQSFAVYEQICQPGYYAWMARAWGYSVFAATDFEATLQAMEKAQLAPEVWNKALQKMRESRRITPEQKQRAAALKR